MDVMADGSRRDALVVRGGWEGHIPVEATEEFLPFLKAHGFAVEVHDSLDVYTDADADGRRRPRRAVLVDRGRSRRSRSPG